MMRFNKQPCVPRMPPSQDSLKGALEAGQLGIGNSMSSSRDLSSSSRTSSQNGEGDCSSSSEDGRLVRTGSNGGGSSSSDSEMMDVKTRATRFGPPRRAAAQTQTEEEMIDVVEEGEEEADEESGGAASSSPIVLVYPSSNAHDAVTLTKADEQRLKCDDFLNDSLIDFQLKYIEPLVTRGAAREVPLLLVLLLQAAT